MGNFAAEHHPKTIWTISRLRKTAAAFALLALVCCALFSQATPAYADGELISYSVVAPASQIEELTQEYEDALDAVDETGKKAKVARSQKKKLDARLAEQRQRANDAARQLYKLQNGGYQLAELLLASESLDDFVKMGTYLDAATKRNLDVLNEAAEECAQLEVKRDVLEDREKKAWERLAAAEQALQEAQDTRAERQSEGILEGLEQDPSADWIDDGVDWYATKEEFMAEWTPRIDAYLAGSPMAGLGAAFAEASWRYCVDPRWSPAISNIESGKGLICVRPYNAWGWGAADEDPVGMALEWGSWESAIDTHVSGLSSWYGYTISLDSAQKYCTNWEEWYDVTLAEMGAI